MDLKLAGLELRDVPFLLLDIPVTKKGAGMSEHKTDQSSWFKSWWSDIKDKHKIFQNNKLLLLCVFVLFLIFSPNSTKTIEKEVVVEKVVYVEKNIEEWKRLKEIDDQAFEVVANTIKLCEMGLDQNIDQSLFRSIMQSGRVETDKLLELESERIEILKTLGY